jgi:hypothetical protein
MNPDDQQRIASWVDGYQSAKGATAVGVVAFDTCGKPIGALVDEGTMAPKETLWQKLTKRLSIGPRDPGTRCVACTVRTGACRCPLRIGKLNGIFASVSPGTHPRNPTTWTLQRLWVPLPALASRLADLVGHHEP